MPGKFQFALSKPEKFDQASYLAAIHGTRKLKPPSGIYVAYGPEEMGVAMVIKVQHRVEWNLVLPTDPNKYTLECGFTYGITSRRDIWDFVRPVLLDVCRSSPEAFELMWEDDDLGDVVEVGRFDPRVGPRGDVVVSHRGLPSAEQFEKAAPKAAPVVAAVDARRQGHPVQQQQHPVGYPQQQQHPVGYPQQQQHPVGYPQQQQHPVGYPQQQQHGYPQEQMFGYPQEQMFGYPQLQQQQRR